MISSKFSSFLFEHKVSQERWLWTTKRTKTFEKMERSQGREKGYFSPFRVERRGWAIFLGSEELIGEPRAPHPREKESNLSQRRGPLSINFLKLRKRESEQLTCKQSSNFIRIFDRLPAFTIFTLPLFYENNLSDQSDRSKWRNLLNY